jgi:hypothetical protein
VDGVTYRYVNIAVDPDSPSRDSKDAGTIPILKSVPGTSPRSAMKTFVRSLVARLCEVEMGALQLPVSAVAWGGDQNAADGGLDVRVDLPEKTAIQGFVPRPATGFQVKKPDMPPKEITHKGDAAERQAPRCYSRPCQVFGCIHHCQLEGFGERQRAAKPPGSDGRGGEGR